MPARLALAFSRSGSEVFGVCPRGSPIREARCLQKAFPYSSADPVASLIAAIDSVQPELIVPCDDRAVGHLHLLYARESSSEHQLAIKRLIEKSLGDPACYSIASSRWKVLQHAKQNGILVPETGLIETREDLRHWLEGHAFPVVLKADGTWGGSGVRVVHSLAEADKAFTELTRPLSLSSALSHVSFHDFFPLFAHRYSVPREITVQTYVTGRCGNAMFACWQGDVLDRLSVEVVFSKEPLGASSIVKTQVSADMDRAGQLLVRDLGISGFCGLDFITEEATGAVYLIELNPRATQLGHLQPGGRDSLVKVLLRELQGEQRLPIRECIEQTIAFYSQAVRPDRGTLHDELHHDVPWESPELMRELRRVPWNRRHASAYLYLGLRKLMRPATKPAAVNAKEQRDPTKASMGG